MIRKRHILAVMALLTAFHASSQQLKPAMNEALQRAYSASVRAHGFDTARQVQNSSQFSAVVVSADGYVLTVAHAIRPGLTYKLRFPDGRTAIAAGLGTITMRDSSGMPDMAMMKIIEDGPFPFAPMGASTAVRKGDGVVGISYPEKLAQTFPTVRYGTVIQPDTRYRFMQTSCAMEPGDSGGPIFDLAGRVIGMNSRCNLTIRENYEVPVDLYKLYWTALQQRKAWGQWPDQTDSLPGEQIAPAPAAMTAIAPNGLTGSVTITSDMDGREQLQCGTVLAEAPPAYRKLKGSFIISKSSCVGEWPVIAGKKAQILARNEEQDLVLLQIDARISNGVRLSADTLTPSIGSWLFTALPKGEEKHGVISCAPFALAVKKHPGFLGAPARFIDNAVTLTNIAPGSPADKAGWKRGDKLLKVDGVSLEKPEDYAIQVQPRSPGEKVSFTLQRQDSLFTQEVVLAEPQRSQHPAEHFEGRASLRADGFRHVFAHDAWVTASECGSPVFDTDGVCHGINIARFSRTVTLVTPSADILYWLNGLKKA
ncbi:trypsin-like peptidase domain-containing protein [Chitinophaga horti]|uniref:Trypsin-like peptidase domain-containing protein n=1 Tax=Chitinophaga horti TaxID=2920382 RepID=A0ABY6J5B0_9BACT|nr:trypsin-like peptidase domain-containing protein [Chitinophaga horti]UYQ94798.1 trypsin-like peptidase domain-containing protein [Chitinophaga horti]